MDTKVYDNLLTELSEKLEGIGKGWLYLVGHRDLLSGKIVGYAMASA
jgi:hypothetical protein